MRTMHVLGLLATGLVTSGVLSAGCFNYQNDCAYTLQCTPNSSGSGGGDGGVPLECDPSKATGAVATGCGVFVSPMGDDKNTGSQALPFKTLGAAAAAGTTVYACAGTMPYTEAVTLAKPVTFFGGLDCAKWTYSPAVKTKLTAAADTAPLTLGAKATGTVIHDFSIAAADATKPGGSSIALIDDQAELALDKVDIAAGKGAAGTDAAMPPAQIMTAADANGGNGADNMSCTVKAGTLGGAPGTNMCDGMDTSGGVGGQGVPAAAGGAGTSGNPMTPSNGGVGQTNVACGPGLGGTAGVAGMAGTGARGAGDVSSSGYTAPLATMGAPGTPGQGGGGGGGAHQCAATFAGPSGGGGGAGGCPGAAGAVGLSGGSSIGILSINAKLGLTTVSISTKTGGPGGLGGDGQLGGNGGQQGNQGGSGACPGGLGGQGGPGGPGGGGAGGHSVAVAFKGGTAPDLKGVMIMHGVGGTGGPGGNMDMTPQTRGDDGLSCKTLDFTSLMGAKPCVM